METVTDLRYYLFNGNSNTANNQNLILAS
uniref:Uncharacterized protein n=1 Tax=Arundo donax TaxID=35708 RepID=A0A0A8XVP2_ARUDO